MALGSEYIYKRKDGRWEARYVKEISSDGRKRYGSVYAESFETVREKRISRIGSITPDIDQNPSITVSQLMEQWLYRNKNQLKTSSYQKYFRLIKNHIDSAIGSMRVGEVNGFVLEQFTDSQLENGRAKGGALSRKTVNDILTVLALGFDFAEEEYGIKCAKIQFLRERKKEMRVLSRSEQDILTAYLMTDTDIYKFGVLLAMFTGIRIGELCALQWENVTADTLIIRGTMQRLMGADGRTEVVMGDPKSESSKREIPLPEFIREITKKFRKTEGFVIASQSGKFTEPRLMQYKFGKMTEALGFPKTNFHALRHTFATRCVEAGFDVKSLSEILGHSDVKTTLNRYVHSSLELKKLNMAKLPKPACL